MCMEYRIGICKSSTLRQFQIVNQPISNGGTSGCVITLGQVLREWSCREWRDDGVLVSQRSTDLILEVSDSQSVPRDPAHCLCLPRNGRTPARHVFGHVSLMARRGGSLIGRGVRAMRHDPLVTSCNPQRACRREHCVRYGQRFYRPYIIAGGRETNCSYQFCQFIIINMENFCDSDSAYCFAYGSLCAFLVAVFNCVCFSVCLCLSFL